MNSATLTIVIVIAVIVILAIGAAVYRLGQKRRSERLHEGSVPGGRGTMPTGSSWT